MWKRVADFVLIGLCCHTSLIAAEPYFASELIFPLNPQHNHAPGIAELADGELFVSWYRGSGERRADDVAVWGARKPVGAKDWGKEFLLVDTPGFPDCNTCLMVDGRGRLTLFWPLILANTWESCVTQMLVTDDPLGVGCPKWTRRDSLWLKPNDFSEPARKQLDQLISVAPAALMSDKLKAEINEVRTRLGDKLYQRLGWQPRCKPTVLPTGRILLPLYSDTFSFSLMAISDDHGTTWRASEPLIGFGAIQPSVLRRDDGTLVAYMRENGVTRKVRVCESKDDGATWGPVGMNDLPNPGSGLDAARLQNGHWLLVYNDTITGRNKLAVSLSTDEGRTWSKTRRLEDQTTGQYHYPAMIQTKNGRVHVVYSYFVEGGKSMKHAEFDEEWVNQ